MNEILSVQTLFLVVAAFFLGSIPFAVVVSRLMGLSDPRSYGSGNPGATNVLRSGSKMAAVLTLVGDAGKGAVAVLVAKQFALSWQLAPVQLAAVALAVFLGHVFSIFLRFKGGKGVATAAGVLLGINGWLGLATLGVWIAVAAITRYSSAAALIAAFAAPVLGFLILGAGAWISAIILMSVILIWRHAENIRRLFAGTESRLGKKKGESSVAN